LIYMLRETGLKYLGLGTLAAAATGHLDIQAIGSWVQLPWLGYLGWGGAGKS